MENKADNISHGVLFLGLGILALIGNWWPGLLIVLGLFYTLRSGLNKNYFKMVFSALLFMIAYACVQYPLFISWSFVLPFIFFALGIEKLFKELAKRRKSN